MICFWIFFILSFSPTRVRRSRQNTEVVTPNNVNEIQESSDPSGLLLVVASIRTFSYVYALMFCVVLQQDDQAIMAMIPTIAISSLVSLFIHMKINAMNTTTNVRTIKGICVWFLLWYTASNRNHDVTAKVLFSSIVTTTSACKYFVGKSEIALIKGGLNVVSFYYALYLTVSRSSIKWYIVANRINDFMFHTQISLHISHSLSKVVSYQLLMLIPMAFPLIDHNSMLTEVSIELYRTMSAVIFMMRNELDVDEVILNFLTRSWKRYKKRPVSLKKICCVCMEKEVVMGVVHGDVCHVCLCEECSKKIRSKCPICNQGMEKIVKIFWSDTPDFQ
jgi:hypothetical protein